MTATMVPPSAAPAPTTGAPRFVAIRANLLPDEIVSARQIDVIRKQVVIGLVTVVLLLVGWYGFARFQTASANGDLSAAQRQGIAYQDQQRQYDGVVHAQAAVHSIQSELQTLMTNDLQWKALLTTIRAQTPSGVTLSSIAGNVGASEAGAPEVLNQSGLAGVGTVSLTGTAPDKKTVAAFADRLAKAKGVAAPFISSVTTADNAVTFSMNVIITSDALGGRFSTSTPTSTGGN